MFCLIMRTAYQGKQFEFLQKEMRPKDLTTIEQMIEENFTFYSFEVVHHHYQEMDFMKR